MDMTPKNLINAEISTLLSNLADSHNSELSRDFITYWVLRKTHSLGALNSKKEFKNDINNWFSLIEANQKFRALYGEDLASKLIRAIEENP